MRRLNRRTAAAVCLMFALAAASVGAGAAPYEAVRIDDGATQGVMWINAPTGPPNGVVVIIPGAQMVAERYTWLTDALTSDGYATVLIEPALQWIRRPGARTTEVPARYVTIPHALRAVAFAKARWPDAAARRFVAVGHSLGAAVLLELLDPAEAAKNPNTQAPAGFAGVAEFDLAVVLGTSLQSTTRTMTLPYRSDTRPLTKPERTRVVFVAAEHDGMATPDLMRMTASRYSPPLPVDVVPGGNHFGWAPGHGPLDRRDLDGPAAIDAERQTSETLRVIRQALQAR